MIVWLVKIQSRNECFFLHAQQNFLNACNARCRRSMANVAFDRAYGAKVFLRGLFFEHGGQRLQFNGVALFRSGPVHFSITDALRVNVVFLINFAF
ncbi:hypothetical protein D3C71_688350 [compost metagenome]